MSANSLNDYVARIEKSGAKVLGRIIWFSIAGSVEHVDGGRFVQPVKATHAQLTEWFDELGLDSEYLPTPPRRVHAFRSACGDVRRVYDLPADGQTAELMVREVDFNPEFRLHHVMREVKDRRGQRLTYTHVATLKFLRSAKGRGDEKSTFRATVLQGLDDLDTAEVTSLVGDFESRYKDLCENLHSQILRAMLRRYLVSLNAIAVRPAGGIYFVHSSKQETVDALATLVKRIGTNCRFDQIPLPDTDEQREMLTEAFQDEVEDDVRLLLEEIVKYNEKAGKKKGVSPTKYAEFRNRLDEIMERSEEYSKVLGLAQERAAVALELALDTVVEMTTRLEGRRAG